MTILLTKAIILVQKNSFFMRFCMKSGYSFFVLNFFFVISSFSQRKTVTENFTLRTSPVSYHLSFDNQDFFNEDFIEQSGKRSLEERKIDFPEGKFGKGIRMSFIPKPPDETNMSGIDLDLVTAVIFNTYPGNTMGYNEPFIWGGGRISPRLGAVSFWAKGQVRFATSLFEQTTASFGRKERDLISVKINSDMKLSACLRDARYQYHTIESDIVWDSVSWNHIVLNWDWASGLELWLNGKQIATSWGKDGWFETILPGLFHLPAPGITYDELYLMDRPLREGEIRKLYSGNRVPITEGEIYVRKNYDLKRLSDLSGASNSQNLPQVSPDKCISFKEIWPKEVSDGKIPAWHIYDGRNEMAWPHEYAFFTIIPGDGDYHAQKTDIRIPSHATVNYIGLTGNLTHVKIFSGVEEMKEPRELGSVPAGEQFFYGSLFEPTSDSIFRIPFTEKYGSPSDFEGDLYLPLSGEKRIQEVGLYNVSTTPINAVIRQQGEQKLILNNSKDLKLDKRYLFAVNSLVARDERNFSVASDKVTRASKTGKAVNIGGFSRLNMLSLPYENQTGLSKIMISLPIRTEDQEEVLFVRLRDPGVPSRLWNQFAVKLKDFNKGFKRLSLIIDFQDIVMAKDDRIWIDAGTAGKTEILIGDSQNEAALHAFHVPSFVALDAYTEKEIIPAKGQYSKQYEFMPWQFSAKAVSLENPYCYGGSFDMILPALAIKRVKPQDFLARFFIKMGGNDFKDGYRKDPAAAPLITLSNSLGAPEWAIYLRDYNMKRWKIMDYWNRRQNPDGQVGGGWNDDTLFGNMGFEDLGHDGNQGFIDLVNAVQTKFELTGLFKDGFCNITPIDRMHTGDFISERYKTILYNLGQAYAIEREMESAWRLGKPDETPVNYYADGFKSSVNVINWYWGLDVPDKAYISKPVSQLTHDLRSYTSVLDSNSFYRMTGSYVMTDDFVPYGSGWSGSNNIYTYMLGGERGTRLDAHPRPAVSWPFGGGPDVSRLIMRADDDYLRAMVYSFKDELSDLGLQVFRLKDGKYKIGLYEPITEDGEPGKDAIWSTVLDISRFDVVTLPIPPKKSLIIEVELIEVHEKPVRLADLVIDPWDAIWENNDVVATVHNIGNDAGKNITVRLYDGENIIGEKTISDIAAPTDFVPKRTKLEFNNVNFSRNLKVVVDPLNEIREILEVNNSVIVRKSDYQTNDPVMWNLYKKDFKGAWLELLKIQYGDPKAFNVHKEGVQF